MLDFVLDFVLVLEPRQEVSVKAINIHTAAFANPKGILERNNFKDKNLWLSKIDFIIAPKLKLMESLHIRLFV